MYRYFFQIMTQPLDKQLETLNSVNDVQKRNDYLDWNEYFMAVSFLSAMRSKDPATQVNYIVAGRRV